MYIWMYVYLGPLTQKEIAVRAAKPMSVLTAMDKIWKSKAISLQTKLMVLKTCVFSSMTYACETWVLTKDCRKKILAFERKCYRKLHRISWTQKMTNKELYEKNGQAHNLLKTMVERKHMPNGHLPN